MQAAASLAVAADHPVARRIAAQAQPDLLILERTLNEKGVLRNQIAVEDIRRTVGFFGSTAGEGGWRVAIVDAVDELNRFGANALLKVLEEPPQRALLFLVSHSAARVPVDAAFALPHPDAAAARRSRGRSRGRGGDRQRRGRSTDYRRRGRRRGLGRRARSPCWTRAPWRSASRRSTLLDRLPALDPRALHALGEALAGTDPQRLAGFVDTVNVWLSQRVGSGQAEIGRLDRFAEAWQRINAAARDAETYNLERKPLVFNVFGLLAEATRG